MYDFIVIGAGYAGLSAAALLAKAGFKILLLESHIAVGGCASYFRRKEFLFDVGATTFSGVLSHQPLGKLFRILGIKPELKKIDPGMIIKMNGKNIIRYSDKEKWIEEVAEYFGSKNQEKFWNKIFDIEGKVWQFISENENLPPEDIINFAKLIRIKNLKYLSLLPLIKRSVKNYADKLFPGNTEFKDFLDEQLLITTQSYSGEAPMITGALGLAYPSETYYPVGGMYKPAEKILKKFSELGGEIKFKEEVISIKRNPEDYKVKTRKGDEYRAGRIISSIPIWNMAKITEGDLQKYYLKYSKKFAKGWGAFVINFAVEDSSELESLYFQIHSRQKIPFCEANSFFVSFSAKNDLGKAPSGFRTVTISIHTNSDFWFGISKEEYERRKKTVEKVILQKFDKEFPHLKKREKLYLMSGTPKSFQFYTKREMGFVGGIPHSVSKSILSFPPNKMPFKNFYSIGDTTFPGQGTPSVVLSALNVYNSVKSK